MSKRRLINPNWFAFGIEEAASQELVASYCEGCDKIYFPPKRVCPHCMKIDHMEKRALSKQGKLVSYTVSYVGPEGFTPPYAYGWVDLPEGIRLFSLLTDCKPFEERLAIDRAVELVVEKIKEDPDGTEVHGFKFRPV